jgi:hypothetical protein
MINRPFTGTYGATVPVQDSSTVHNTSCPGTRPVKRKDVGQEERSGKKTDALGAGILIVHKIV